MSNEDARILTLFQDMLRMTRFAAVVALVLGIAVTIAGFVLDMQPLIWAGGAFFGYAVSDLIVAVWAWEGARNEKAGNRGW